MKFGDSSTRRPATSEVRAPLRYGVNTPWEGIEMVYDSGFTVKVLTVSRAGFGGLRSGWGPLCNNATPTTPATSRTMTGRMKRRDLFMYRSVQDDIYRKLQPTPSTTTCKSSISYPLQSSVMEHIRFGRFFFSTQDPTMPINP